MGRDVLHAGDYQMPTSTEATASLPDEPALLRIEGPIATITLNRPAAFNSIDLSIAKKLEQLGAEIEANDDIRVLVVDCRRRSANDRRRSRVGHDRAGRWRIAEALSRVHRNGAADAEDRAVQRSRLRRWRRNGTGLCYRPLHRRRRRPLHAGLRQDRRLAG